MKLHPNELLILYNTSDRIGKQARAYAHSISNHVNEIDYLKAELTTTIWQDLLNMLQLRPKDLLNRADPHYQAVIAGNTFDDEGWLNILINNPNLIRAPIAIKNNRAIFCIQPTEILKLV